jgi:Ca-activated chloride channel family protein
MSFVWPHVLLALGLVPVLSALYLWMQYRRERYALRYASVSLVREAVGSGPGLRRHIPAAVYLLALAAMIFALARPQTTLAVPFNTGTVMLVIDVSGSMRAEDVQPDRMEATKVAARLFVEKQPEGVKVGVVSFSDFGALIQAPTRERDLVLDAIDRLQPQRGTNIAAGLIVALDAIYAEEEASSEATRVPGSGFQAREAPDQPPPASIVLVSDGASNTGPPAVPFAQEAADNGIKVYTIGIGTPEGATLQIEGRSLLVQLDEATLRELADLTGGRYLSAQDEGELTRVYDELARERVFEDEKREVTYAVTGVAMAFTLLGGVLSLLWFNRLP